MSNYIKTTDFAAKDALPSGNPSKLAQGTQVDTEFNNIATAVATKEDLVNRAVANGYASLDSSGDVPDAQIPATIPRLATAATFTGNPFTLQGTTPSLVLDETDAAADEQHYLIRGAAGVLSIGTASDAAPSTLVGSAIAIDRTGTTVSSVALAATTVTVNGQDVRNTAILNAGTLADARVAASNVTQHQAALTILETQITDGSLLARLAANETVSGQWTFSDDVTITSTTPQLILIETGVTADNTRWDLLADAEGFRLRTRNDANSAGANIMAVERTGTTVDSIAFASTALTWNGNTLFTSANDGTGSGLDADTVDGSHASSFAAASHGHTAAETTSGTFVDARIAQSNVTQHQAALSLTGTQVSSAIVNETANFSVTSSHAEDFVICTSAGTITVTVGLDCLGAAGRAAIFTRQGTGAVTFAPSGVTINSPGGGLSITTRYGKVGLIQIDNSNYELTGNI
jgi:hypothetical protein